MVICAGCEHCARRRVRDRATSKSARVYCGEDGVRARLARSHLSLTSIRVRSYSNGMRYSPEHKAQNHEKILSMAARSFREPRTTWCGSGGTDTR